MTSGKASKNPTLQARLQKSWVTIALIVICCLFLWSSFGLSQVSAWISQLIMCISLVFLLLQLASEIWSQKPANSATDRTAAGTYSMISALMWIGIILVMVWLLGISIGAALFCIAYLSWHAHERWPVCIVFGLALGLSVQLFFGVLLQMPLYRGVILPFFVA